MTPFRRVMIRIGALVALSVGVLTACTVVDESGSRPRPRPEPSRPQMCTMEYDPVCAQRGNSRRTFSNACQARADGYRITGRGECRPERPDFGGDRPQACTREYDPVCARQGRRQQTFANACMAQADGFRVIGRGECRRPEILPIDDSDMRPPPDRRPQACTREFAPVCARQGRREQTFPNACTAQAQGFRVIGNGGC
ncbi:Kazal-type serine protease inhibitor domain-containing protein [Pararhizobium sp. BT-229]|uniref:Kazal-type serine protease inhibitor domain-containing protein n=1 Tax=Pararhizobium sp. BT-229 TaxID=2986923 RepID=UPI0021F7D260|nr:Kazal-type serine protease inhibitor domain-containing protein [Pararhizobium sp. BT-229]MCV9960683.1 Kazal-type serine protease inhibitor domain-containing protein [Pararhizobium sp. BT-229]